MIDVGTMNNQKSLPKLIPSPEASQVRQGTAPVDDRLKLENESLASYF